MILKNKTWNVIVATEVLSTKKKLYPTCWILVRPQHLVYPSFSHERKSAKRITTCATQHLRPHWMSSSLNPGSNSVFGSWCVSGSLTFSKFAGFLAQCESTGSDIRSLTPPLRKEETETCVAPACCVIIASGKLTIKPMNLHWFFLTCQ